jgi:hypothetical protein
MTYILIFIVLFFGFLIWGIICARKKVLKDWDTLDYLKKKANQVSTKEEIEEFYKEFLEKASEINNHFITPELMRIDGYIIGLYKQYKNETTNN